MYALVKIKKNQLLTTSLQLPLVMIDQENGVIEITSYNRSEWMDYSVIDYIEQTFWMQLKDKHIEEWGEVPKKSMLLYIGKGITDEQEWNVYDLDEKKIKWAKEEKVRYRTSTKDKGLTSIQYLECIIDMIYESKIRNRKLIIFTDLEIKDFKYRYRSLLDKVVNYLLESVNAVIIHKTNKVIKDYYVTTNERFEPYINQAIYTDDTLEEALKKINILMQKQIDKIMIKKEYRLLKRVQKSLYTDIFYKQIKNQEEIYVTLLPTSNLDKVTCEKIGLEYIKLLVGTVILRGKKSVFDRYANLLNNEVVPQYRSQILTYPEVRIAKDPYEQQVLPFKDYKHKGEGVLLGVIGVEGINYEESVYFTETGEMKITYIWEQEQGKSGIEYNKNQLAVRGQTKSSWPIYTDERLTEENILFKVASGITQIGETIYKGIATKAQFVIGKIKSAPYSIQEIYGGKPNEKAVLLEDVIIAVDKLITFAKEQNLPLVLAIPFSASMSSHDGLSTLEEKLGEYAYQTGVSIVTSTGEEADKKHHQRIELTSDEKIKVTICVQQADQKVLGGIWNNPFGERSLSLYDPNTQKEYSLDREKEYVEGETKILTTGSRINAYNGLREIVFRLDNLREGTWEIWIQNNMNKEHKSIMDIWLAQYEINPYVLFESSDALTTITSLGNIQGVICVGDYDSNTLTTYKTSGRGYTRRNLIKPTLVVQGKTIFELDERAEQKFLTGSIVTLANTVGAIGAIYSKLLDQKVEKLPSTVGMASLLISKVNRLDTVDYPNPTQGNGIFDRNSLDEILDRDKETSF